MPLGTFLNGRDPVRLRGLQWLALSETAIVQRRTATSDAGGGATYVWSNYGTVECRVDPLNVRASSRLTGGRIDERSTHVVTCPTDAVVSAADRVSIGGRGTFEVTQLRERTGEWTTTFEVMSL